MLLLYFEHTQFLRNIITSQFQGFSRKLTLSHNFKFVLLYKVLYVAIIQLFLMLSKRTEALVLIIELNIYRYTNINAVEYDEGEHEFSKCIFQHFHKVIFALQSDLTSFLREQSLIVYPFPSRMHCK